jgi:hypothetical protein
VKLFVRRSILLPSWPLALGVLLALVLALGAFARGVAHFLAQNEPTRAGVLVVEGWLPRSALGRIEAEISAGGYDRVIVSGGPIRDRECTQHETYAERTWDRLRRANVAPGKLYFVPSPASAQARTYLDAVMVREWLSARDLAPGNLDVLTGDVHARRSRDLYQRAFGEGTSVGVIALPPEEFEYARWWRTSSGAKAVSTEFVGWLYARCCLRPGARGSEQALRSDVH